jgi:hypothetical protein
MTRFFLPAVATAFLAFGVASAPASAAPAAPVQIEKADGVTQVRYMGRRHMMRRHMRSRAYRPSQAGNARNPSRPVRQQNQGQTTGGPRF